MTIETARFEKILRERKAHLETALEKYEASLERPKSADFEDGATERENDEVIEGLGNFGKTEIRLIDAALARIENGSFGLCARCGKEILAARLETVPHAVLCRSCA